VRNAPVISDSTRARLAELANRQLNAEEWQAQAAVPLSRDEVAATLELVRWFRERYPTATDRLTYARRAYARWRRAVRPG
jgi:hypothetical protein